MVLPPIRPLTEGEWDNLVAALQRGPTPEQVRIVERAEAAFRHVRVRDSSTMKLDSYHRQP